MDVIAIIAELRKELERIDQLILALDTLQHGRRRGRPPKLLQELRQRAKSAEAEGSAEPAAPKKAKKKAAKKKAAKT
jgi:hypothetical protein